MNATTHSVPTSPKHGPDKAIILALTLAQAENAIHAFTSGQIDAVLDSDGNAYLMRAAQEQFRQNEKLLQAMLDSAADVITVVNRGGVILFQSQAVRRVLGYEPGELVGSNLFDFIHEEDLSAVYLAFFDVIEGVHESATVQFCHRFRDGTYRMIEASVGKLCDPSSAGVVLSLRPITKPLWKRAEPARPGGPEMPQAGEERERIMLSHGRQIPLPRNPTSAWTPVNRT